MPNLTPFFICSIFAIVFAQIMLVVHVEWLHRTPVDSQESAEGDEIQMEVNPLG